MLRNVAEVTREDLGSTRTALCQGRFSVLVRRKSVVPDILTAGLAIMLDSGIPDHENCSEDHRSGRTDKPSTSAPTEPEARRLQTHPWSLAKSKIEFDNCSGRRKMQFIGEPSTLLDLGEERDHSAGAGPG